MAKELKINRTGIVVICALGVVVIFFLLYQARGGYVEPTVRVSQLISASIQLVEDAGKIVVGIRKSSDAEIKPLLKGTTNEGKGEYVTLGDKVCVCVCVCTFLDAMFVVWMINKLVPACTVGTVLGCINIDCP